MSTSSAVLDSPPVIRRLGRPFFHPVIDVLLVCGGLSVPVLLGWSLWGDSYKLSAATTILIYIAFNYAHFASSTIRLYTKPGEAAAHRFLAWGLPVMMLTAILGSLFLPEWFARNFTALFLTWSPYHYAAQAYGIAMIYAFRSGAAPSNIEKRWLWWTCMLPFLAALLNLNDGSVAEAMGIRGIRWFLPESLVEAISPTLAVFRAAIIPFVFLLPVVLVIRGRLPALAGLLILTNGLWLVALPYFSAAIWITVAHSIQYLCLVTYVHAKDYGGSPGARFSPTFHAAVFYLGSAIAGVLLFYGLPFMISGCARWAGHTLRLGQVMWMVTVALNIHHFVVDAYIWRSKRKGPPSPAAQPAG